MEFNGLNKIEIFCLSKNSENKKKNCKRKKIFQIIIQICKFVLIKRNKNMLYLGSSSLSSIDCLYESATCKEQAGGPAVVCRSASPIAKSVLVSENPFVFRVFEVRTFFAEEVPLYILHIRGLSFRLLWEEDHVDCRRGISSLLFRKGNPHFKEGFC